MQEIINNLNHFLIYFKLNPKSELCLYIEFFNQCNLLNFLLQYTVHVIKTVIQNVIMSCVFVTVMLMWVFRP